MRKTLVWVPLLIMIMMLPISAIAQSIFWEETFVTDPGTWTFEPNWSVDLLSESLFLNWDPQADNYDLSATSPVISLPANVSDILLSQWFSDYSSVDEVIEVYVIAGESEIMVWSHAGVDGDWGVENGTPLELSLRDYASQDVQLKFRSHGSSSFNINWWIIYDIVIYAAFDNDLSAHSVVGPAGAEQNVENNWSVIVKNAGVNTIPGGYQVDLFVNGTTLLGTTTDTDEIASGATIAYPFPYTPTEVGTFTLSGSVTFTGDEFTDNDTSSDFEVMVYGEGLPFVLIWDNDNGSHYTNPETGGYDVCENSLSLVLDDLNIPYLLVQDLPQDISSHEIVFVELGLFCVG
jgi:CARDB